MCADQVFRTLLGETDVLADSSDLSDKRNYIRHVFTNDGSVPSVLGLTSCQTGIAKNIISLLSSSQKIHFESSQSNLSSGEHSRQR
jgi:hypothetical protein